ncbi:hypothetical protein ACH79_26825 [Bradyrhizobium sp. CCBAU 051011]|uniref:hypothetical protein n=1 Tax=Bradyrhizobium sp. CCBAU 051011 TaxID=858422 RepID=UPI001373C8A4|nr:hypothetical protein [Bradyrhizobium sp. CCBAU 051011]QHO75702.1 hypothetical protein ACH79_26825 [Bradyrhizobium sp. CCBAU 051011]
MLKISIAVWIVLRTALAGSAMIAVLSIPSLAIQRMKMIPVAASVGFLIAMPLSYLIAIRIGRSMAS